MFVNGSAGQKSFANRFDCRAGETARRARVDGHWLRCNMAALWGRYVRLAFASREAVAAHYGVTFQTACNWWDESHAPAAAIYARASIEDGERLHAVMVGAR